MYTPAGALRLVVALDVAVAVGVGGWFWPGSISLILRVYFLERQLHRHEVFWHASSSRFSYATPIKCSETELFQLQAREYYWPAAHIPG